MDSLSDEELATRYQRATGSSSSDALINELFQRHYRRVGLWCYRICGNQETAADLAQEIFTKAFQNLSSFRGDSKFTTWLYTITRNHCLNSLKAKAQSQDKQSDPLDGEYADARQPDPLLELQKAESIQFVRNMMAKCLDETEAKVMTLHFAEAMPLDAVTRLLSLTNTSGAKAYIVSAKRKLRTAMERLGATGG